MVGGLLLYDVRRAGILLHITSLPEGACGDFGTCAFRFVDFLSSAGQTLWQILPLNPTSEKLGNSPYNSISLFAGNPIFIDLHKLYKMGLINKMDLEDYENENYYEQKVNYQRAYKIKRKYTTIAFESFKKAKKYDYSFEKFCEENNYWLEDYSILSALKLKTGKDWYEMDDDIKFRRSLNSLKNELKEEVEFFKFEQFIFFEQYKELKDYANSKKVFIIGDLPIYPSFHSSDVWANPHIFKLDSNLRPIYVSGVPPDLYSETGQLWGTPVYNWENLRKDKFLWWIMRIRHAVKLFDFIRIDHFRGFVGFWEIPAGEKTAVNGRWESAPAEEFFSEVKKSIPNVKIISEDLGFITNEVKYIKEKFGFPGMKIIQFSFEEGSLPHTFDQNSVVYPGTHDNLPIRGWFKFIGDDTKKRLFKYVGREFKEEEVSWEVIKIAYSSPSRYAIVQMQDILSLGEESRMNFPSKPSDNWIWRLPADINYDDIVEKLLDLCKIYNR